MRKVCYSCININHFITSFILASTKYKGDENILIISNYHRDLYNVHIRLGHKKNPFSKIIMLNSRGENIKSCLKRLKPHEIDILHYFSFAFFNKDLLRHFRRDKTKVILTEEGITTYDIEGALKRRGINNIGISNFDELMIIHPNIAKASNIPIEYLDIKALLDDYNEPARLVKELCLALGFKYDVNLKKSNYIFFDQPLSKLKYMDEEIERGMFKEIISGLGLDNHLKIKLHPSDKRSKYRGVKCEVIGTTVPWELILLYEHYILGVSIDRIYITYYSAGVSNSVKLSNDLGVKTKGYFIYDYLVSKHKEYKWDIVEAYLQGVEKQYDLEIIRTLRNILKDGF